jgi:predicted phage tail protein
MKTINLKGWMAEHCGMSSIQLAVKSVTEAVRALEANFPGLRKKIYDGEFAIQCGSREISDKELDLRFQEDTITIHPVVEGAGNAGKGWAFIIIGAILVVASFYMPQGSYLGAFMFQMGIAMAFGGIAVLLTPSAKTNTGASDSREDNKSFLFNGPLNSAEQGGSIPIVYGEFGVGSTIISSALQTEDIA